MFFNKTLLEFSVWMCSCCGLLLHASPVQSACSGIHELCLLSLALCCSWARLTLALGATAFPQDVKELSAVQMPAVIYTITGKSLIVGDVSQTLIWPTWKIQMWLALPAVFCSQPFCLAVLMMCEAHGRHCCSWSLLVFYSISPPGISSEDAILICL